MELKIIESSFHRNGIGGNGFYAIRFQWKPEDSDSAENFLATLFDEAGSCAVIGLDRIPSMGIAFAQGNSWRGDHFESELRQHIKEHGTTTGIRIGPFAIGTEKQNEKPDEKT